MAVAEEVFQGRRQDSAPSETVIGRGESDCIKYLILGLGAQAGIVVFLL